MKELKKLIDLKSIVTLLLIVTLVILVVFKIKVEEKLFLLFSNIITAVITFYFTKKNTTKNDQNTDAK